MELNVVFLVTLTITIWLDLVKGIPTFWCPVGRYPTADGQCDICFENCGAEGCTGPGSYLGEGGCTSCWLGQEYHHNNIQCISPFRACPSGFYRKRSVQGETTTTLCKPCHPLCSTCSGPGLSNCTTCTFLRWDGQCVQRCPTGTQFRPGSRTQCVYNGAPYSGSLRRHLSLVLLPYRDRARASP